MLIPIILRELLTAAAPRAFAAHLLVVFVLLAPGIASAAEAVGCGDGEIDTLEPEQVAVSTVSEGFFAGARQYAIQCGDWRAEASYQSSEPKIALTIETGSGAPAPSTAIAARLYRVPLAKLFSIEGRLERYALSVRGYEELGMRMARAALASKGWDARRGRARDQRIGAFVSRLINEKRLHAEVVALFAELGYRVRATDAEEVRLCPAADASVGAGAARGKAPCGGLIYFELLKEK